LTSGRVEAFSDGIFAIAATLLILNVELPRQSGPGLFEALVEQWPQYATFAASFMTVGIMWLNHHALFVRIHTVDRPFLFLNLLLLLTISFLPFPTEVLGRNFQPGPGGQTAALFYAITCLAIALGFGGVYGYIATHPELVSPRFEGADFMAGAPWFLIGLAAYCVCIPLSFVSPPAVLALIAAVAVYYVFDHLPRPTS
jgi:uncharacterized membrane protein